MSRVKNKDTDLEVLVRSALHKQGLRFRKHENKLSTSPELLHFVQGLKPLIIPDLNIPETAAVDEEDTLGKLIDACQVNADMEDLVRTHYANRIPNIKL